MLKGFKDFILRGNVIELAVAVVIGSAFTAIVTAFTDNIINPLIAALGSSPDVDGLAIELRAGDAATRIDFGAVITAGLNFLIIAAVVYFILVAPMNKLNEMQARRHGVEEDEEEKVSIEAGLLSEIRDLLREQQDQQDTGGAHRL
ncbi:large-conductance mechanosensitive channel protein MscL [Corynebacterium lowii]|uniref:Large-conductance mechanosensitive channel n=1 Tax=Corynebacterium lowii TaxID=1544413 RepID=A0A0Q0Z8U1_9CORY|nr:large-conductance mechanosensitive channel protein MscL [Corynebacterium lowii]KQB86012.1 Large-conductance mechanosensitive channel [Corynebacterium lowii]MDP9850558.1 large conductance mechanosensitive channel [Corynebacterium lowii]